jgi:hypothetical protein
VADGEGVGASVGDGVGLGLAMGVETVVGLGLRLGLTSAVGLTPVTADDVAVAEGVLVTLTRA